MFRGAIALFLWGCFLCLQLKAQNLPYDQMQDMSPSMKFYSAQNNFYPQEDKVIDEFQSRLIEDLFTKPLFDTQSALSYDEDGDQDPGQEDNVISSKAQKEIMNDLLSKEFAKVLAQKDMLKLRETLRAQIHRME